MYLFCHCSKVTTVSLPHWCLGFHCALFKKQLIESSIQPIELALTMSSAKFSFLKSFPKPSSVKQPIETTNQQVIFHYFEKQFSFERTWLIQFWIKLRVDWKILIYPEPMPTSSNLVFKQSSWILFLPVDSLRWLTLTATLALRSCLRIVPSWSRNLSPAKTKGAP